MFLLDSGRYAQDPQGTEQGIRDLLAKFDADVVGVTPWQEGKLAYEIDGHRKGLHLLTFFKMDGSRVQEFNRTCKLSDLVIRQLLLEHSPKLFELLIQQIGSHELSHTGDDEPVRQPEPVAAAE